MDRTSRKQPCPLTSQYSPSIQTSQHSSCVPVTAVRSCTNASTQYGGGRVRPSASMHYAVERLLALFRVPLIGRPVASDRKSVV